MALPETVPTKVSSEQAGYVSITPVELRELPLVELLEQILAVTGKNAERIRDVLARGSFVNPNARYRWEALEPEEGELAELLARFPDAEPGRPFDAARCTLAILRGTRGAVELTRAAASERRWFQKRSFWDLLMRTLETHSPSYERYSYSERADVYVATPGLEAVEALYANLRLLKYTTLIQQLTHLGIERAELFVER